MSNAAAFGATCRWRWFDFVPHLRPAGLRARSRRQRGSAPTAQSGQEELSKAQSRGREAAQAEADPLVLVTGERADRNADRNVPEYALLGIRWRKAPGDEKRALVQAHVFVSQKDENWVWVDLKGEQGVRSLVGVRGACRPERGLLSAWVARAALGVWHNFAVTDRRGSHVVVVGSGLAGLVCARELAQAGLRVTLLTASRPGRDGATHRVHGLAPWILLSAPWVRGDSPQRFLADLRRHAAGLARPGLDELFAEQAHSQALRLAAELDLAPLGEGPVLLPGDQVPRGRRWLPRHHGPLLEPLLQQCRARGVEVCGREMVVGLLTAGARVAGVMALRRGVGGLREITADAVVLACGGAGAVFPCSTSPRWCCGSALAFAEAGGILLHHPHLTQALPVTATPPLFFPTSAALVTGQLQVDGCGHPPVGSLAEATLAVAWAIRRGASVALLPPAEWNGDLPASVRANPVLRRCGPLPLRLALHHSVGGVAIDSWGRTSACGLYACGEAAGGVQGGCRTMGTGLLEAFIFGQRAGQAVARDVARLGRAPAPDGAVTIPQPAEPGRLSQVLNQLLEPLTEIRPRDEIEEVLRQLRQWPLAPGETGSGESGLVALRLAAAQVILGSAAGAAVGEGACEEKG